MTEGISWGKMDSNGFNNSSVIHNPDILILGSSHMEATNVFQKYNTTNQLIANLTNKKINLSVYNQGISGHNLLKCCQYLNKNAQNESIKYVIIETQQISFNTEEIESLLNNQLTNKSSHDSGFIVYLQKLPFFRLVWFQFEQGLLKLFLPKKETSEKNTRIEPMDIIENNYDKLFSYIKQNSHDKRIVIFYHPTGKPQVSGNLEYSTDNNYLYQFGKSALKYGIDFIDLTNETDKLWQVEHKTTHGFCTGTAFSGHLNKNGHNLAARCLANYIFSQEMLDVSF